MLLIFLPQTGLTGVSTVSSDSDRDAMFMVIIFVFHVSVTADLQSDPREALPARRYLRYYAAMVSELLGKRGSSSN
jgi:hypothetical protein